MREAIQWEQPLHRLPRLMIWFIVLGVVAAVIWASYAKVSVYADVRGALTPKSQPVQVNAPRAGRVLNSNVQQWQQIKKGDRLFTLDSLARDSEDAQLQLSIQQSAAQQARQDIIAAQIDLKNKTRVEKEAERLYKVGALSQTDMDMASAAVAVAQSALQRAKSQLASAQAQLAVLARNQRVDVVSPVDGQIMQLSDLHHGQTLSAGESALAILPQGGTLVFRGNAAERDRPKLQPSARVQIAWNSYPRQKYGVTDGVLSGIAPTSTVDQSGLATYQMEVQLPNGSNQWKLKDKPLLPGMAGEAHVLSTERPVLRLFWDWIRGVDPWS